MTSACHSDACGGPIALALLEAGRSRLGERVRVYSEGEVSVAEVCSTVFLDPESRRLSQ